MPDGVKETLCTRCMHKDVCAYKLDYLNILKAVENARVSVIKENTDGGFSSKKVADYDFISEISVGCRYFSTRLTFEELRDAAEKQSDFNQAWNDAVEKYFKEKK